MVVLVVREKDVDESDSIGGLEECLSDTVGDAVDTGNVFCFLLEGIF